MQVSDQNCKNQLYLILFFFQVPPFASVDRPWIKQEKRDELFNNRDY